MAIKYPPPQAELLFMAMVMTPWQESGSRPGLEEIVEPIIGRGGKAVKGNPGVRKTMLRRRGARGKAIQNAEAKGDCQG
jgi:hypothetical protein